MTTTKSLEQQIERAVEQIVREHLAACEAAAAVAVRAAFKRASEPASKPSKSTRRKSVRAPAPRRSREELAALEERLYEAILAQPGERMVVLAPVVGASARALNRPATNLRRQGRVRSVGGCQYTRYFPMGEQLAQAEASRDGAATPSGRGTQHAVRN